MLPHVKLLMGMPEVQPWSAEQEATAARLAAAGGLLASWAAPVSTVFIVTKELCPLLRRAHRPTDASHKALSSSSLALAALPGMQLLVVTATGRREQLDLAQEQLTAAALHAAVAARLQLPPIKAAYLRLVCGGQALTDDEAVSRLKDGGA